MIQAILADHRHYHSDWQIDHAITIRAGGTLYGCYKQAVRELHKRWRGLREVYANTERLRLDVDDLEQIPEASGNNARRRELDLAEKRLALLEANGVVRDTEREFLRFLGQAVACRTALGIPPDGTLDEATRDRLDAEMWEHQIKAMAAVDFMAQGRIGRSTIELLAACSPAMRRRIAALVLHESRHHELIEWYLTAETPMPPPVIFTAGESREALEWISKSLSGPPENGTAPRLLSDQRESTAADWRRASGAGGDAG